MRLLILPAFMLVAADRPNVLVILSDDQGYGDLRCHGNDQLDTPRLDHLAEQGARLTDFHVCPLCAPTRAGLLTGRYHLRTGVTGVTDSREVMRAGEQTLAEMLRPAGYATACFGKWHNGAYFPNTPAGQGFDRFLGFRGGHLNNYFRPLLEQDGEPVRPDGFVSDVLTDAAIEFVTANRNRPWLCYLPYNVPHSPYQCPDALYDKYRARGFAAAEAAVYAMIENMDANVGRLLDALDETDQGKRTIVWFLSDNGPNTDRFNDGLRGRKGSLDEGGTRVPCLIRYPVRVPAGRTIDEPAAHIDLVPTIREWCGIDAAPDHPLDGVSLVSLLDGTVERLTDRAIFFNQGRRGELAERPGAVRTRHRRMVWRGERPELYDLAADRGQRRDVAAERPDELMAMRADYLRWFADVTRVRPLKPAIPLGHAAAPVVELLAPDAELAGVTFRGKNGFANDWIGPWTDGGATAVWELDSASAGRYRVAVMYCCGEVNLGTTVRVCAGPEAVEGTVKAVHAPELWPSPDRVRRIEAYEKDWRPMELGEVSIPAGRSRLELRASPVGSGATFEVKAVRLSRSG